MKRLNLRSSLILKLMGAFLLVIAIGALVIYVLTTQATQNAFRLYTTQNSQIWAQRLAPTLADFYAQTGSWQGISEFVQASLSTPTMMAGGGMMHGQGRGLQWGMAGGWMGGMDQRLILADTRGMVIVDTIEFESAKLAELQTLTGSLLSPEERAGGAEISVNGQQVGTLILTPGEQRAGPSPASTFLASVERSILVSVLIAGGVGLLLVSLLFFQITAPIREMQKAAGAIANGDLTQRVPVRARDELGGLAESFNHMAGSLARAETQRQKLLADVAHELRTPLAVIQANTEGIQDGVLPLDMEQINAIHAETLLLGRLINDLRLISLAEAGELRLERRAANLAQLLQTAAERFQPQSAQKVITLSVSLDPDLPFVWVDVDRLNQVLNNLVSNALRYTPEGGQVTLHARRHSHSQPEVHISVVDSGVGIAADDLPWVFDRFYRADKSRARLSGGSGLGLAIVKQLVEAHGGVVSAHSPAFEIDGRSYGTRITFSLPAL